MQQPDPRPIRRFRRTAFGLVGVVVVASGVAAGSEAAFAVGGDTQLSQVTSDFSTGASSIVLGADFDDTMSRGTTLTLGDQASSAVTSTLNLNGHSLSVQAIELTANQAGSMTASSLTITGSGTLTVTQSDHSLPAIEADTGSTLTFLGGTVVASVPADSSAAAIGGGPTLGATLPQYSGTIVFNGSANVSATGGSTGAGIGAGAGASATSITIGGHAQVTASAAGGGAAIGDGSGAASVGITIANQAKVWAYQNGTGSTGAAIGGGASPTGQTAGSVSIGDDAQLVASSTGAGAAVGGGYHGDGGTITATGYASISATGAQAAIGDGEHSTGAGSSITASGQGVQVTAHGGTGPAGGAGIGGGSTAYGNDSLSADGGATVVATSDNGPGIGGLGNTVGMGVSVGNATVTASGGSGGAAIGAGSPASIGASLSITSGGTVHVSGNSASALGGSTAARFGSVSNSGALSLTSGTWTVPSGSTATNSGTFTNAGTTTVGGAFDNSGTIANTGTINGTGALDNQGTILQNGTLSTSSITGNNFDVDYDPQAGTASTGEQRVYAPSVSAAGLTLPTASPTAVGSFTGWNAATDGTGSPLRSGTTITSDFGASSSGDGKPVTVRAYAQYQLSPVLPTSGTLAQGVVGTPYSASVAVTSGTAPIIYSYTGSLPAGLKVDSGSGAITGTPTTMGTFTMHVTATNALTSATHDYTIQIVPTPITLSVPTTSKGSSRYLAGSTASLRIANLQTNETYTVKIGGKVAATGKASSNNAFTLKVTVPKSIGEGSQTVSVSGGEHANVATSKILTASVSKSLGLKLSAKKVKHGKKIVITVSKLYAGESARVVVSGKHGKTAVGKATSKGVYVVTLKSGLAKGKYTVTVTGAGTSRKASAKLTVS